MPRSGDDRLDLLHEDNDVAELDKDSFLHWKEHLYRAAQSQAEGHHFFIEALRSSHLEGKVGYRESVALKNLPPTIVEQPRQPGNQ